MVYQYTTVYGPSLSSSSQYIPVYHCIWTYICEDPHPYQWYTGICPDEDGLPLYTGPSLSISVVSGIYSTVRYIPVYQWYTVYCEDLVFPHPHSRSSIPLYMVPISVLILYSGILVYSSIPLYRDLIPPHPHSIFQYTTVYGPSPSSSSQYIPVYHCIWESFLILTVYSSIPLYMDLVPPHPHSIFQYTTVYGPSLSSSSQYIPVYHCIWT